MPNKNIEKFLSAGVKFIDPQTVYIDESSVVAASALIGPNVQIYNSKISAGVKIEGTACIINSEIGESCEIKFACRLEGAKIAANCSVGPFAQLRPGTVLENHVRIGNFVETKNTHMKTGAKANHLTYLGDAEVGEDSNVGAGTITCNYDGARKHKTKIGKNVFIGSNTALVAPVEIGDGATIGAGSTIRGNVAENSLALSKGEVIKKLGWQRAKK